MNRRSTIATLLGKKTGKTLTAPLSQAQLTSLNNANLDPYQGPWEYEHAAHLLRRTTFGPSYAEIKSAVELGLTDTIAQLFKENTLPDPPVNYDNENDPNVAIGETWIDAPYSASVNLKGYRKRSLRAWIVSQMLEGGISIREQLVLFWHNHFAVSNVNDPKFNYRHLNLIRSQAWGNFKHLIREITIDPTMLRFLNGNQNTKEAPNENYARELLELYTIGKGDLAGPGDYTTFTEDDVVQIARVLTGWRDRGYNTNNPDIPVESYFRSNRHDTGDKQLSHRFDEIVISNAGNQEYLQLIDIIFQKEEVARFISRKLYRWFVYYTIDEAVEVNVIEPMAQIIIDNNYEIRPALEALLCSQHFFEFINIGPMIKNPIQFGISALRQFGVTFDPDLRRRYIAWYRIFLEMGLMDMVYLGPPNVAGWKAYYQEPLFYRTWINASTLQVRMNFTTTLATNGFLYAGRRVQIDVLKFIQTIDAPTDPNSVIDEFAKILFPQPITDGQKKALKEILIPGLPDFEWTVEYGKYLADPSDQNLEASVESKLRNLVQAMVSMAEFYLS